jgi:isopentenyl-diphosphate delta-isomerase
MEQVVLVDENDSAIGEMEKMQAHRLGVLHRAFSVFIFNDEGEMLLQQRAKSKYHSGGLWTNACCGHPRPGEDVMQAAIRRLGEEMGFETQLELKNKFIYKTKFDNSLIEHELDHIFIGTYSGTVQPNPDEADSFLWIPVKNVLAKLRSNPENFTVWFKIIAERFF